MTPRPRRRVRRSAGRPTKWTPERTQRLLTALGEGNTRRTACALAGLSEDTFGRRMLSHADFAAQVTQKEAEAEAKAVATVLRASRETWQAAAWWLERKHGWVRRLEHTGKDGGPIQWDMTRYTDEELAQMERLHLKGQGKA